MTTPLKRVKLGCEDERHCKLIQTNFKVRRVSLGGIPGTHTLWVQRKRPCTLGNAGRLQWVLAPKKEQDNNATDTRSNTEQNRYRGHSRHVKGCVNVPTLQFPSLRCTAQVVLPRGLQ